MKAPVIILFGALLLLAASCAGPEILKKTGEKKETGPVTSGSAMTNTAAAILSPEAAKSGQPKARGNKFKIKQLVINSDTMNYNKETSEAVFRGNVVAEAADVLIKSDMLVSRDYKQSAQATGNVRALYKQQGVYIECGRLDYKDKLSMVYAYDDVTAHKKLANGDTVVLKAEELQFNAADNTLTAKKVKKRIRITMKDIIAFCDEVRYNDETRELYMTGFPLIKKSKSLMIADSVLMNVDKKSMKLTQNIWTKLFYKDFETAQKEVQVETNKNGTPGKDVQQKTGSK